MGRGGEGEVEMDEAIPGLMDDTRRVLRVG